MKKMPEDTKQLLRKLTQRCDSYQNYLDIALYFQMVLLSNATTKKVDHLRENRNQERQYVFDVVMDIPFK